MRNPFRMAIRPGTNDVFIGDVGSAFWDEIDRVPSPTDPMRNFGWPCYEGGLDAAGDPHLDQARRERRAQPRTCARASTGTGPPARPTSPTTRTTASRPARAATRRATASRSGTVISALAFYPQGGSFPATYHGALFFADYARQCIWAMLPGTDGLPGPAQHPAVRGSVRLPGRPRGRPRRRPLLPRRRGRRRSTASTSPATRRTTSRPRSRPPTRRAATCR